MESDIKIKSRNGKKCLVRFTALGQKRLMNLFDQYEQLTAKLYLTGNEIETDFLNNYLNGCIEHLSEYDSLFPLRKEILINKIRVALYRLEYPHELSKEYHKIYSVFLRNNADLIIPLLIGNGDIQMINRLGIIGALSKKKMNEYLVIAQDLSKVEIVSYFMDYKHKVFGIDSSTSFDNLGEPSEDWETLENMDGTLTVKKYLGKEQDIIIPSILDGKRVSKIEGDLWSIQISILYTEKDYITSVIIEDGIQEIGDRAFLECRNLEEIIIPDSVKKIGKEAFSGCRSLRSIIVPKDITEIQYSTFSGCNNLTSIVLPDGLRMIGYSAFEGCSRLASINIPDSVEHVGRRAFSECSNLKSITIPGSIEIIDSGTFFGCKNLKTIDIPDGVKKIGYHAFSNCSSLTTITIPDSVEKIETGVFENSNISCIVISNYDFILSGALSGSNISSFIIPEGVKGIGSSAFANCHYLGLIVIPKSIQTIGDQAFSKCSGITSIVIPEGVQKIEESTFFECSSLTSIIIPESVQEIGSEAFFGCSNLTSITIPDEIKEIGPGTFAGCTNLTSIIMPSGVQEIKPGTFYGCSNLSSITIPEDVKEIHPSAFKGCDNLVIHAPEGSYAVEYAKEMDIKCIKI